jgi:hypothetical protein
MELNFWCQMAVGDRKSGLEWLFQRWPPGSDVDEQGRTLRVMSQDTYRKGMGWMSHDFTKCCASDKDIEEELLHEAWDGWEIDVEDWHDYRLENDDIHKWVNGMTAAGISDDSSRLASLDIYGNFLDSISAADVYAGRGLATGKSVSLSPDSWRVQLTFIDYHGYKYSGSA